MAKVQYTHDEKTYLTEISVNGCLSIDEIIHYSEKFYKRYSSPLVLWDAREATHEPIMEEEAQKIAIALKELAKSRPAGKTAFVCKSDAEIYELALFSKFATEAGATISYKAFTDIEKAKYWLMDESNDDFELIL